MSITHEPAESTQVLPDVAFTKEVEAEFEEVIHALAIRNHHDYEVAVGFVSFPPQGMSRLDAKLTVIEAFADSLTSQRDGAVSPDAL